METQTETEKFAKKYRQLAGIKEVTDDIYIKLNYIFEKIKHLPEPIPVEKVEEI